MRRLGFIQAARNCQSRAWRGVGYLAWGAWGTFADKEAMLWSFPEPFGFPMRASRCPSSSHQPSKGKMR